MSKTGPEVYSKPAVVGVVIEASVERVLETMCFSAVMGPAEMELAQASLGIGARVDFQGPTQGAVLIGCSPAGAQTLTRNFLGTEDITDLQVLQFVSELANMICGAVVSTFGAPGQYDLGSPDPVASTALVATNGTRVDFEVEEGFLSVVAYQA